MPDIARRIADNVAAIRARMAEAAARSGRSADEVRLVAVTKSVGVEAIRATVAAGCHELGESRVQQLAQRAEALRDLPIRWHMIGPLQRNKVRRVLETAQIVHSADSVRLVEAIDRIAGELSRRVPLLIEVNVSGEAAKHGFAPDDVEPCLAGLAGLGHFETVQIGQQGNDLLVSCTVTAVIAPGGHHNARAFCQVGQYRVCVRANRFCVCPHHSGVGCPERKEVRHAQGAIAPVLGELDATSNGGVVFHLVRRAGVQPDEHGVALLRRTPTAPEAVPVGAAG